MALFIPFASDVFAGLTELPVDSKTLFFDVFLNQYAQEISKHMERIIPELPPMKSPVVQGNQITFEYTVGLIRDCLTRAEENFLKGFAPSQLINVAALVEYLLARNDVSAEVCVALMRKKNHDYAGASDSLFGNLEAHGVRGVLIRLHDKVSRLETYVRVRKDGGRLKVKDETTYDTIVDIWNYCALATALWSCGLIDNRTEETNA